jgi:hypothetical protein
MLDSCFAHDVLDLFFFGRAGFDRNGSGHAKREDYGHRDKPGTSGRPRRIAHSATKAKIGKSTASTSGK